MASIHPTKRIGWGIACAVLGMLLNLGIPQIVIGLGLRPTWLGGGLEAVAYAAFIGVGFIVSGLAGLASGIVRPGLQSLSLTLICLVVVDICLLATSVQVYAVSAVFKGVLIHIVESRRKSQLIAVNSTAEKI